MELFNAIGAFVFVIFGLISLSLIKDGDYGREGMGYTLLAGFGAALMML
jgi:hypothetical protein